METLFIRVIALAGALISGAALIGWIVRCVQAGIALGQTLWDWIFRERY